MHLGFETYFFLTSASAVFSSSSWILKSKEKRREEKKKIHWLYQKQWPGGRKPYFCKNGHLRINRYMSTELLFACLQSIRYWTFSATGSTFICHVKWFNVNSSMTSARVVKPSCPHPVHVITLCSLLFPTPCYSVLQNICSCILWQI